MNTKLTIALAATIIGTAFAAIQPPITAFKNEIQLAAGPEEMAAKPAVARPEKPGKKRFENFEVLIVSGHDKDGRTRPPYLIITEQRLIGNQEIWGASLKSKTLEVLVAGLLVSTTSNIQVGEHTLTVIRKIYEFKPPVKRYILTPDNFDELKDSYPFRGLIIDTDGKQIHGDIGPESQEAEQAGTGQPATRPESKSEGGDKPQPESEGRSR
jgi:hypothetical protein